MPGPTVVAYWPKRTAPVTVIDVAMGKPVSSPGAYPGFAPETSLTAGTTCYNKFEDCFCSLNNDNWVVVDLQASLPIRKVVITGPTDRGVNFFLDVVVRAGNTGLVTDPIIGTTPSTPSPNFQTYTMTIASGNVRYIRLQYEAGIAAICFCKVQAFL
ncbi:uncharacterized protein LOC125179016 [Hyalella azteca]|uniref:Uncharacterized protein LOC125179016 n=1 Tax=Hyalella azteca TaxID=294128 RepID=A0A979FTU3_HYAAZ|nr:uncharacterized protein LOC125179016 [Hyalella azteca]